MLLAVRLTTTVSTPSSSGRSLPDVLGISSTVTDGWFAASDAFDPASRLHVASIGALEDDFAAARAAIVWVLETDDRGRPGTLSDCTAELRGRATTGFCVGDVDTQPDARAFQNSPFAVFRGFTAIVRRSDMRIEFVTTHGTPSGNENLTGAEVLDALQTL